MNGSTASEPLTLDRPDPGAVMRGLEDRGAVLVRAGADQEQYRRLGDALAYGIRHHATGTHERDLVDAQAHVSTVNKGVDAIPLHREASYLPEKPDVLLFWCERPPSAGGRTTLCDGVALLDQLPGPVRAELTDKDTGTLAWDWELPPQRWKAALGSDTVNEAERRLAQLRDALAPGEQLQTRFVGERLHGHYRQPALIQTRFGGLRALCNSILAYYDRDEGPYVAMHLYHLARGDGSPIAAQVLQAIRACAEPLTYRHTWQAGDIVCVDNSRFMHGREPITDPRRRVLVRLGRYRNR